MQKHKGATATAIMVIVLSFAFFFVQGEIIRETAVALTAILSIVALYFQMKRGKDITVGEFILELNKTFSENTLIMNLYVKVTKNQPLEEEDRSSIMIYLTFFETLFRLMERDVIDIRLLDDLFRYRFFIVVNNKDVQAMELLPDAPYYRNIYTMDFLWIEYIRKKHKEVPPGTLLSESNKNYKDYVIQ